MTLRLHTLLAAHRADQTTLEHLHTLAGLVPVIGTLVHELQRERGLSSLHLASGRERFGYALREQVMASQQAQADLLVALDRLNATGAAMPEPASLATALQGLDALASLRLRVQAGSWTTPRVIEAYAGLITLWLEPVARAAHRDAATPAGPALAALHHLMQAKESAGRERAHGARLWASGLVSPADRQALRQLVREQERAFTAFAAAADTALRAHWCEAQRALCPPELAPLRRDLLEGGIGGPDITRSDHWFTTCSRRLNVLRALEETAAAQLSAWCAEALARGRAALQALAQARASGDALPAEPPAKSWFGDQPALATVTPAAGATILTTPLQTPATPASRSRRAPATPRHAVR